MHVTLMIVNRLSLGQRIESLREAKKWSQEILSAKSGVAKNTINAIEQGKGNPTLKTLEILEKTLGDPLIQVHGVQSITPTNHSMLQTVWASWPNAPPEVKVLCLYVLTALSDYVSLLPVEKRAKVLNAARVMGLKPPKEFS